MRRAALPALLLVLAGCLGAQPPTPPGGGPGPSLPAGDGPAAMTFSAPMLIDDIRAGGEPVIAVTHNDVLIVSAHPGYTHLHTADSPTDLPDEALLPTIGQSYLWTSTDMGQSWEHIGAPMAQGQGPRGAGFGISDPDLTVTASNRVYLTDLEALASASVSWSDDDGATWLQGNSAASGGAVDRQWLASIGDTVFFTANYFSDHRILRSNDGLVWERMGDVPCSGDIVGTQEGLLYAGCGAGVAVSADQGATWEVREANATGGPGGFGLREPAVDGAGNVWVAYLQQEEGAPVHLWVAGSPDQGATWPWVHDLTSAVHAAHSPNETESPIIIWPWTSAGSAGRVAVSVFALPASLAEATDQVWSVVTVGVFEADSAAPRIAAHLVREGHHLGQICRGGTFCQVGSLQGDDGQDRRLGDFFETTIDRQGFLHLVFANTSVHPQDWVSHPEYVRQVGGPTFLADDDDFEPLQG